MRIVSFIFLFHPTSNIKIFYCTNLQTSSTVVDGLLKLEIQQNIVLSRTKQAIITKTFFTTSKKKFATNKKQYSIFFRKRFGKYCCKNISKNKLKFRKNKIEVCKRRK